ncbi:MAG: ATP-binding protein [Alphaproteobacteria bacterium]
MARLHDNSVPFLKSLLVRGMSGVLLLVGVIGVASFGLRAAEIRKAEYHDLLEKSAYLTQTLSQAFVLPGLQNDAESMQKLLDGLDSPANRDFCGAKVTDRAGKVLFNNKYPDTLSAGQSVQEHFIVDIRLPKDERRVLARFWLCTSTAGMEAKVAHSLRQEAWRFGMLAAAVLLAMYASMLVIVRPLRRVTEAMDSVAREMHPIRDRRLLKRNEIGALARGFNSMLADLAETYDALEVARQKAVDSENSKSDFLANMSHELRTPLNNIIGSAQLLHDRPLEEQDRELFTIMEKASKSLLSIVNDILDLSKIEAGQVKLEIIPFDAFEKVRDVKQMSLPQASHKGLTLLGGPQGKLLVKGDPLRIERILTNLVGNALRYTERGSITINASAKPDGAHRVILRCEVADTGIGIPKERQDKIFERFTQADSSTSRKYGGTGLGLTITRELVALMQGKIGLESEPGVGTTFWFEIPLETAQALPDAGKQAAVVSAADALPAATVRVLVAEDHDLNRAFMRRLFGKLGLPHFTFSENGRDALAKAATGDFDLVLMDCHMPEMDGYTATAEIRKLKDKPCAKMPIVAMTANAMSGDEERCLKAGMNAYISKPFEINTFKRILSPWVDFDRAAAPGPDTPAVAAASAAGDLIDMSILASTAGGDEAYIKEMVGLFIDSSETLLQDLAKAGSNVKAWEDTAHTLKGSAGIVGAGELRRLAAAAQDMKDPAAFAAQLAALRVEFVRVKAFFKEKNLA